jgi:hypothetical protein
MNHPLMASIKEIEFLQSRIVEKNARIEKLEAVLRKYSTHTSDCGYRYGHDCDCGVDEIRAVLDQSSPP